MWRRLLKFAVLGSIAVFGLIVGTIAGCNAVYPDATTRLARTFDIDDTGGLERPEATGRIEAAIATKLPLGTSGTAIREYLAARGVGRDGLSSVEEFADGAGIGCRFDFDPRHFAVVHPTHWIKFTLDADGRLEKVEAETWYTGP